MPHRHQQLRPGDDDAYAPSQARGEMPQIDMELVCLSCGGDMHHLRTIPRLGVLPDLFVFRCPSCRSVQVVEPSGVWRNARA
jgi:hypothetical protein